MVRTHYFHEVKIFVGLLLDVKKKKVENILDVKDLFSVTYLWTVMKMHSLKSTSYNNKILTILSSVNISNRPNLLQWTSIVLHSLIFKLKTFFQADVERSIFLALNGIA